MSIIPTSAIEQHLQSPNTFTLTSLPAHSQIQCQSTTIVSTPSTATTLTENQQIQTTSLDDAQQQDKLVFNDKNSPPLQLIFQLPPVPQGTQQQQLTTQQPSIITSQAQQHQISSTQTIAQTQTGLQLQQTIQQQPPNLIHQNTLNLQQQQQQHQQHLLTHQNQVVQHCNQHSQVYLFFDI